MLVQLIAELPTDSKDYDVLAEGVSISKDVEGMACEIGVRRGGGSKVIIDALQETGQNRVFIAVDPWGNVDYPEGDRVIRCDYTNEMYADAMVNLSLYCSQIKQNFIILKLEDTEFFKRYADGVPFYNNNKVILNKYSIVHLDGPHNVPILKTEIDFFNERMDSGAVMVFDDVALYDHNTIHTYIKSLGWNIVRTSERKWMYTKQ